LFAVVLEIFEDIVAGSVYEFLGNLQPLRFVHVMGGSASYFAESRNTAQKK
jgi:hypothetical protein